MMVAPMLMMSERPHDRDGDDGEEEGRANEGEAMALETPPRELPLVERLELNLVIGAFELELLDLSGGQLDPGADDSFSHS